MKIHGFNRLVGLALLVCLLSPGLAFSQVFLRGDANDDGRVSIADSHYIANFLFRGGTPSSCRDSADTNGDAKVNITDGIDILNFLFMGGVAPPEPFPEAGESDLTSLPCEVSGEGAPLQDPSARLAIRDVTLDGSNASLPIEVVVSNSAPIAGYSGRIQVPDGLIGQGSFDVFDDLSGTLNTGFHRAELDDNGDLLFGFLATLTLATFIPAGDEVAVARLEVCLADNLVAGEYSLSLVEGELVDAESGRAIIPQLESATMTLENDLDEGVGCTPISTGPGEDLCDGFVPEVVEGFYRITGGPTHAGASVDVPVSAFVKNGRVQGYAFSIDFDETALQVVEMEPSFVKPDGTDYGFAVYEWNNGDSFAGSDGVDEGFAIGAAVFSFTRADQTPPPDEEVELARIRFDVAADAEPGTTAAIRFLDGAQGSGQPVRNSIAVCGEIFSPDLSVAFLLVNASVEILPDITTFVRGDSNGDGDVDVSDAQATLGFLFLGESGISCFDAADANDNGQLDISDALYTLNALFTGGRAIPPPFPAPGEDPTPDSMDCLTGRS